MKWPRGIYVATVNLGVYYTDNFTDPSIQPTWTQVNTGLASVGCREFKVDPFDGENRQYVLTESDRILYRRDNQGSWASVLTPAAVDTLLSTSNCGIQSFCVDPSTPGRLWALVGSQALAATPNGYWAIYSNNYGASWTAATKIYSGDWTRGLGTIRANGDNIWCSLIAGIGNDAILAYSYNGGTSWTFLNYGAGSEFNIYHNPIEAGRIYFVNTADSVLRHLESGSEAATNGFCDSNSHMRMWFDAADADHQRAIYGQHLLVTENGWNTYTDIGAISPSVRDISLYSGVGEQMLAACALDVYNTHVIGAIAGEVTAVTGVAGTMPATAPYTDSIPNTCGGACIDGVQGARALGVVRTHGVAMPDYAGDSRGEPLPGDRAAWEASNYPTLHADDRDTAGGMHHTLGTGANQAASGATVAAHLADTDDPHEVTAAQVGLGNVANLLDNLSAATAPTVNDDSADGYAVGSKWIDTTADKAYVCLDATEGAAVWQEVGAGGGGSGDMLKSTYDTDDDGVVDEAEAVDGVDAAGNSKYYGTDGAGTPGFHSLPAGGVVDAADVTYTPVVLTDWDLDTDPGAVDDALDQLAERVDDLESGGGGSGDVVGPSSAVDGNLAVFDGTTGKLIKDGGALPSLTFYWATGYPFPSVAGTRTEDAVGLKILALAGINILGARCKCDWVSGITYRVTYWAANGTTALGYVEITGDGTTATYKDFTLSSAIALTALTEYYVTLERMDNVSIQKYYGDKSDHAFLKQIASFAGMPTSQYVTNATFGIMVIGKM